LSEALYGELPEKFVDPELVRLGRQAFDFCLARYGDDGREIRLRWMKKDASLHVFSQLEETAKKIGALGGRPAPERMERGYIEEDDAGVLSGLTRMRLTGEKSKSNFINADTPVDKIVGLVGHEFYHFRFSLLAITPDQVAADECAADAFGARIEKEMGEEAAREADEKWRARFREIQSRRK